MLRFLSRIIGPIFLTLLLSCGKTLVGSNPTDTPKKNFQILWDEFDRYYAFFEVKNVNWNILYDIYASQVTDQTDDHTLFDILSSMLAHLDDDHVDLITPVGSFNSGHADGRPEKTLNLDLVKRKYLRSGYQTTGSGYFISGQVADAISYVQITSFSSENGSEWVSAIDPIVNEFFDYKGLILDVRSNPGGNGNNAKAIAGRFADQRRLYFLYQERNGRVHSDFGPIRKKYVEPAGNKQFTKPVVVLIDRRTTSAAESFVLAMKQFPHVRLVGDTTAGNTGNNIFRELPNGWIYRISVWKKFTPDDVLIEGIGIPPDIHVAVSTSDDHMEKDAVIETAIQLLND